MMSARPRRLLLVVRGTHQVGGLETVVRDAAAGLEGAEFHVTVGVLGDPGTATSPVFEGLRVVPARDARGLLSAAGPVDLVHLHSSTLLDWSLAVALRTRRRRLPLLVTLHLPAEPRGRHLLSRTLIAGRRTVRALALRASGALVLAPSRAAADLAHRRLLRLVDVAPLLQGVRDPRVSGRAARGHDGLRVAFVGRMVEQKQPALVVEAVAQLRERGTPVSADLVGDGPLLPGLRRRAEQLGLAEQEVRFHAHLSDPLPIVAAADALVLPSIAEGLPVVVMEAAALARPSVVRAGIEGVEEILPGAHVTIARDAGARELAERLAELAENRGMLAAIGRRARDAFEASFSLPAACERYAALYRSVLERSAR